MSQMGAGGSVEPGGSMDVDGSSQKEALAAVQHGIGSAVGQAREVVRAGQTALEERQHNGAASSGIPCKHSRQVSRETLCSQLANGTMIDVFA